LCARQRWRRLAGKTCSTAAIAPGAAVGDHQHRVAQAAAGEVAQELHARAGTLLQARQQPQQVLDAGDIDAPGRQHRLARLAQVQPLGHAVEEQVRDVELAQVAPRKSLVLLPQPLAHRAGRRARQHAAPRPVGEGRLDVAHGQPARVHLHGQAAELFALARQRRAHLAFPARQPAQLRSVELDHAFGAVDVAAAHAVAHRARCSVLAGGLAVLVVAAPQRLLNLGLQRLLDEQPRGLAHETPRVDLLAAEHRFKTLARGLAGRYLLHRDAPFG